MQENNITKMSKFNEKVKKEVLINNSAREAEMKGRQHENKATRLQKQQHKQQRQNKKQQQQQQQQQQSQQQQVQNTSILEPTTAFTNYLDVPNTSFTTSDESSSNSSDFDDFEDIDCNDFRDMMDFAKITPSEITPSKALNKDLSDIDFVDEIVNSSQSSECFGSSMNLPINTTAYQNYYQDQAAIMNNFSNTNEAFYHQSLQQQQQQQQQQTYQNFVPTIPQYNQQTTFQQPMRSDYLSSNTTSMLPAQMSSLAFITSSMNLFEN